MSKQGQPRTRIDPEVRQIAQTEFARPILLEAGAGTGKTAVLVARIAAWALGPGWDRARTRAASGRVPEVAADVLRRIVAITFTEAAAGEMANRLRAALVGIRVGELPPGFHAPDRLDILAPRAEALVAVLEVLPVQTIHAFCRGLLSRTPIEAGLHPQFKVDAEGLGVRTVAREVVESAWSDALGDVPHPDWLPLVADDVGPRDIEEALVVLLWSDLQVDALTVDPFASPILRNYATSLSEALKNLETGPATKLVSMPSRSRARKILDAAAGSISDLATLREPEDLDRIQLLWPLSLRRTLNAWSRRDFQKSECAAIGDDATYLSKIAGDLRYRIEGLVALRPKRLRHSQRVLAPLLSIARERLRSRGIESFSGLLYDTRRLLQSHPEVASAVRRRIDQILVDEFQDTDHAQCAVLECLALDESSVEKPGLFLVGDPKQSVYGFRNANLRAYERFGKKIELAGGLQLGLTTNFRSAPKILKNVERIMAPIMQARPGLQPAFQPIYPSSETSSITEYSGPAVEYWLDWFWEDGQVRLPSSSEASELEALNLANDLLRIHNEGHKWASAALLFRSHSEIDPYLAALRQAGIPYRVSKDRDYYQRREIIDAIALLRCVLDPTDHLSLVTWLRSPYVGVPDAALLPLWNIGFPKQVALLADCDEEILSALRNIIALASKHVPKEAPGLSSLNKWDVSLFAALEALAMAREASRKLPSDDFVNLLRRLFLVEATEAIRHEGRHRVENLERLWMRLIAELNNEAELPGTVLERLRRALSGEPHERQEPAQESGEDAVHVTTIHSAKGLDFDHVYLLRTHRGIAHSSPSATHVGSVSEHQSPRYQLLGSPTLSAWSEKQERAEIEHAEQVRLVYVAITRARRRLVIAGRWPLQKPPPPEHARSLVDLIAAHRGSSLKTLATEMARAAKSGTSSWQDESDIRWVFLGLTERGKNAETPSHNLEIDWPKSTELEQARLVRAERQAQALVLKQKPYYDIASKHADQNTTEAEYEPDGDSSGETTSPVIADRKISLAFGEAIHAGLETIDFTCTESPSKQLGETALQTLKQLVPARVFMDTRGRLLDFVEEFTSGLLFARLRELSPHIIARELPILVAPDPNDDAVSFISGTIDLLYDDPRTRELVIVDYKTDQVSDTTDKREATYRAQGTTYVRAVKAALQPERMPRFELWWLRTNSISTIPIGT